MERDRENLDTNETEEDQDGNSTQLDKREEREKNIGERTSDEASSVWKNQ